MLHAVIHLHISLVQTGKPGQNMTNMFSLVTDIPSVEIFSGDIILEDVVSVFSKFLCALARVVQRACEISFVLFQAHMTQNICNTEQMTMGRSSYILSRI